MQPTTLSDFVIDISHYEEANFKLIKAAGIVAVIHKATEGLRSSDKAYAERKQAAIDEGLLWGAYHFGLRENGADQADFFLDRVQPDHNTFVAVDFETPPTKAEGPAMLIEQAVEFVERVHSSLSRYPYFYSGDLIKTALGSEKEPTLGKCRLWLAEYGPTPHVQVTWSDYTLWQYTESGVVEGVGKCDRNKFKGDLSALRDVWSS